MSMKIRYALSVAALVTLAFVSGTLLGTTQIFNDVKAQIQQALAPVPQVECPWPCYRYNATSVSFSTTTYPESEESYPKGFGVSGLEGIPMHVSDMGDHLELRTYVFVYYRDPMYVSVDVYNIFKEPGVLEALQKLNGDPTIRKASVSEINFQSYKGIFRLESIKQTDGNYLYKQ